MVRVLFFVGIHNKVLTREREILLVLVVVGKENFNGVVIWRLECWQGEVTGNHAYTNKGNLSIHITIFFIHITLFESCFFFFLLKNICRKERKKKREIKDSKSNTK